MLIGLILPLIAAAVEMPRWWIARAVVDPAATKNDRAVANLGQLKWFANQADAEMDATLFGGLGTWEGPFAPAPATDYNVAQIGHLKNVSKDFWDKLRGIDEAYTKALMEEHDSMPAPWGHDYPWDTNTTPANKYSKHVATIGDLKMVFGFALRRDADGDGLVDYQELKLVAGGDPEAADPDADTDGDGFNNIIEVMAGTDATQPSSKPEPASASFEVYTVFE